MSISELGHGSIDLDEAAALAVIDHHVEDYVARARLRHAA